MRQNRETALMLAASNGHTDTVRLLLEHGADVNLNNVSAACVGPAHGWWLQRNELLNAHYMVCSIHFFTCYMLVSDVHVRTYCTPGVLCGSTGSQR